jgi:predicted permease
VVLAGSALLLRTFERLRHEPPGFDATNVLTVWTQLPYARYGDSSAVAYYARLTDAVRKLPGVRAVGVTSRLPLGDGETLQQSFTVEGGGRDLMLSTVVIDDGYLGAVKIPLLAGHGFDRTGVQRDGDVMVSRRAAETIWHDPTGRAAIGQRLTLEPSGPTYTIVGVVGDVHDRDLSIAPSAILYAPHVVPINLRTEPGARRTLALVARTEGAPTAVVAAIRQTVHDLDPTVPIFNVETMTEVVRASTARLSFALMLMSAAAAITLVLGAIGLYGVMAYMVALRTREFGVRIALGADPLRLARSVVARGLTLIALGVLGGLVLFALVAPFLGAFLYGVAPSDPLTLAGTMVVLAATGTVANWLPARRAAHIDPVEALRAE